MLFIKRNVRLIILAAVCIIFVAICVCFVLVKPFANKKNILESNSIQKNFCVSNMHDGLSHNKDINITNNAQLQKNFFEASLNTDEEKSKNTEETFHSQHDIKNFIENISHDEICVKQTQSSFNNNENKNIILNDAHNRTENLQNSKNISNVNSSVNLQKCEVSKEKEKNTLDVTTEKIASNKTFLLSEIQKEDLTMDNIDKNKENKLLCDKKNIRKQSDEITKLHKLGAPCLTARYSDKNEPCIPNVSIDINYNVCVKNDEKCQVLIDNGINTKQEFCKNSICADEECFNVKQTVNHIQNYSDSICLAKEDQILVDVKNHICDGSNDIAVSSVNDKRSVGLNEAINDIHTKNLNAKDPILLQDASNEKINEAAFISAKYFDDQENDYDFFCCIDKKNENSTNILQVSSHDKYDSTKNEKFLSAKDEDAINTKDFTFSAPREKADRFYVYRNSRSLINFKKNLDKTCAKKSASCINLKFQNNKKNRVKPFLHEYKNLGKRSNGANGYVSYIPGFLSNLFFSKKSATYSSVNLKESYDDIEMQNIYNKVEIRKSFRVDIYEPFSCICKGEKEKFRLNPFNDVTLWNYYNNNDKKYININIVQAYATEISLDTCINNLYIVEVILKRLLEYEDCLMYHQFSLSLKHILDNIYNFEILDNEFLNKHGRKKFLYVHRNIINRFYNHFEVNKYYSCGYNGSYADVYISFYVPFHVDKEQMINYKKTCSYKYIHLMRKNKDNSFKYNNEKIIAQNNKWYSYNYKTKEKIKYF